MKARVIKVKVASTVKTRPFDVANYLRTPKEQAEYLNAWLQESPEDTAGFARALGDVARARGMSKVARASGLSRESLYKALSERGNPSFATVMAVSKALDLSLQLGAAGVTKVRARPRGAAPVRAAARKRRVLTATRN